MTCPCCMSKLCNSQLPFYRSDLNAKQINGPSRYSIVGAQSASSVSSRHFVFDSVTESLLASYGVRCDLPGAHSEWANICLW